MACGRTEGIFVGSRPAARTQNGTDSFFHMNEKFAKGPSAGVLESILDAVGSTPMIKLTRLAARHGLTCDLLAKCEFLSAGGSVKDRAAKAMIEKAEKEGVLKRGDTLIEPTSGNTGIGMALAAAVKGYNMIVTMPDKMSTEKSNILKCLGATIIRTPTEVSHDDERSHIKVAEKLQREIPNSHILDQYRNAANPQVHYHATAEEILVQCGGHVDMAVIGAGTGGTVTGVGKKLKERCPACKIIGVDPVGSVLAEPEHLNDKNRRKPYQVEGTARLYLVCADNVGIGYDFVPEVLDRSVVDWWVKVEDVDAFCTARELLRVEGLLVGGSSGACVWAAFQVARKLGCNQKCVVILPDSSRNYMSKFICDQWMCKHGYLSLKTEGQNVFKGLLAVDWLNESHADARFAPVTATRSQSVRDVVNILYKQRAREVIVLDDEGEGGSLVGVLTEDRIFDALRKERCTVSTKVMELGVDVVKIAPISCRIDEVAQLLEIYGVVYFTREPVLKNRVADPKSSGAEIEAKTHLVSSLIAVITKTDLVHWLISRKESHEGSASQS